MENKTIAYTNQHGKLCKIVSNGEQIWIEETQTQIND